MIYPLFDRYFEGGVSSVYLWDLDHGFAGVILIKKAGDGSKKIKGCWDSIHVVEVQVSHNLISTDKVTALYIHINHNEL